MLESARTADGVGEQEKVAAGGKERPFGGVKNRDVFSAASMDGFTAAPKGLSSLAAH